MSAFVIYVSLPRYLREWLTYHMGEPVVFPPSSPQNVVIRTFTRRLPDGAKPKSRETGQVAITIPDSVAKPPETYNDIGERGCRAVAEMVKDLFLRNLWADMDPLAQSPVSLNKRLYAWCEAHGISEDGVEAVRQCYNRIRHSYSKRGVNLKARKRYDRE